MLIRRSSLIFCCEINTAFSRIWKEIIVSLTFIKVAFEFFFLFQFRTLFFYLVNVLRWESEETIIGGCLGVLIAFGCGGIVFFLFNYSLENILIVKATTSTAYLFTHRFINTRILIGEIRVDALWNSIRKTDIKHTTRHNFIAVTLINLSAGVVRISTASTRLEVADILQLHGSCTCAADMTHFSRGGPGHPHIYFTKGLQTIHRPISCWLVEAIQIV